AADRGRPPASTRPLAPAPRRAAQVADRTPPDLGAAPKRCLQDPRRSLRRGRPRKVPRRPAVCPPQASPRGPGGPARLPVRRLLPAKAARRRSLGSGTSEDLRGEPAPAPLPGAAQSLGAARPALDQTAHLLAQAQNRLAAQGVE